MSVKNKAGIKALEFNILVEPDQAEAAHSFTSADGNVLKILKPDDLVDKEQVAATSGIVLDVSETAFTFEHGAERVEVGDRIVFARYAGLKVKGADGKDYLMLKDKSVCGVYQQEQSQ